MTPHELGPYRERMAYLFPAAFGWRRLKRTEHHERDGDCSWEVNYWAAADGRHVLDENDMGEGLLLELLGVAELLLAAKKGGGKS